jgi:hypothetical protein
MRWSQRRKKSPLSYAIGSNSANRRAMVAMLPMNRRTGRGNFLMSVGVASDLANVVTPRETGTLTATAPDVGTS